MSAETETATAGPPPESLPVPAGQPAFSSPAHGTGEPAGTGSQSSPGRPPGPGQPAEDEAPSGPGDDPGAPRWTDLWRDIDDALDAERAAVAALQERLDDQVQEAVRANHAGAAAERETRSIAGGRPFDVEPGSEASAASCPECGYTLSGRPAVLALSGKGARRMAVAVHKTCPGEPA